MTFTKLEEQIIRATGISRKDFEATRAIETAEQAAAAATGTSAPGADGLTASDEKLIKKFGLDRARFIAERRAEQHA